MQPTRRQLLAGLLGATSTSVLGTSTPVAAGTATDAPLPNHQQPFLTWPSARGGAGNRGTRPEFAAFQFPLEEQWRVETAQLEAPVIAIDGTIVTVEASSDLVGYDELTGDVAWRFSLPTTPVGTPAVGHGIIVVALPDGAIVGLNAATGTTVWERSLETTPTGVTVAGDTAYVTGTDAVVALTLSAGTTDWTVAHDRGELTAPMRAGDTIITHDKSTRVLGITAAGVDWETTVSGLTDVAPTRTDAGVVVLSQGTLTSIDPADGSTQWTQSVPARSLRGLASRAGFTTVTNRDRLVSLSSLDGESFYTESVSERLRQTSPQVLTPNYVVVATQAPDIRGYDILTGEQAWTIELPAPSQNGLLLGPHKLVCAVDGNTLVSFQASAAVPVQTELAAFRDQLRAAPAPIETDSEIRSQFGSAAAAYVEGDFETATTNLTAAQDRFEARQAAYEQANARIETLEAALEDLPDGVDQAPILEQLETARDQLSAGEYAAAQEAAAAGLAVVDDRLTRLEAAQAALQDLEERIAAATDDGLVVEPAVEDLDAARAAFDDGAYEEAAAIAADGLETVDAIEQQATAAQTAIETAAATDTRHTGIDRLARRLGYDQALAAAQTAYEAGDYDQAEAHAVTAQRTYRLAALIVDGSIGGPMAAVVLYKLRPAWFGRPLDRLVTHLPEDVPLSNASQEDSGPEEQGHSDR